MGTTNNPQNNQRQLLHMEWDLAGTDHLGAASLNWLGNEIHINVRSFSAIMCTGIRFEISFNGELSFYKMMYSNRTATKLKIPDIHVGNNKLVITALPKSLEVMEVCLNSDACFERIPVNQEDEDNSWIMVTQDLQTRRCKVPHYNDGEILVWIHSSFNRKYDANTDLCKYEVFSPDLYRIGLKIGSFTCLNISDFCSRAGCGTIRTIKSEISDINGTIRSFVGSQEAGNGVIEIIGFMRSLQSFDDWKDYDWFQELCKLHGVSCQEIHNLLSKEISDIRLGCE